MIFEIGRSNKSKDTLIYNGYEFTKKQKQPAIGFAATAGSSIADRQSSLAVI